MNKIGHPTYITNYKFSLIVIADGIESVHGPPLYNSSILDQLQRSVKAIELCCVDNEIINTVTLQVFMPIRQVCQLKVE